MQTCPRYWDGILVTEWENEGKLNFFPGNGEILRLKAQICNLKSAISNLKSDVCNLNVGISDLRFEISCLLSLPKKIIIFSGRIWPLLRSSQRGLCLNEGRMF
jgi:hypothetical protein